MITHSYITTVLESYDIAARQIRYLSRILPDNWELVFVDDGSDPEIPIPDERPRNMTVIRTGDTRPWTQDIARNKAAQIAAGEYLLMADIDHVFTPEAIQAADKFGGEVTHFYRLAGTLHEDLVVRPDSHAVYDRSPNIFLIRKDLFTKLGGYLNQPGYGNDLYLVRLIEEHLGRTIPQDRTSTIYVMDLDEATGHHCTRPW